MRNAFAAELARAADADPRVVMLSGDIGNRLFDAYKAAHPDRFFNCGVAEANMVTVAAGLAAEGLRPVAYTIAPFVTLRVLEQIRVDLCCHDLPVVVAGVGAGLSYASLGPTHHSMEDVACLRALPNMTVVCPADPAEARLALRAALAREAGGPVYLRLGKKGEPAVHASAPDFRIGRALVLKPGRDAALLAAGTILPEALAAAELLAARGVSTEVVSFHTLKPLDEDYLAAAFARFSVVAAMEEHGLIGGLGAALAEWACERDGLKARLCRIGARDEFLHECGDQAWARGRFGLTAAAAAGKILARLGR
ncbi:MAG: transketolase [Elusimicrobia bacterium]|nr:transketolase [Elusimicrobiota bacterium]